MVGCQLNLRLAHDTITLLFVIKILISVFLINFFYNFDLLCGVKIYWSHWILYRGWKEKIKIHKYFACEHNNGIIKATIMMEQGS